MSPKFRGRSEDWLDDEDSSGRGADAPKKKEIKARAVALPLAESNATVVEVFPKQCRVRMDSQPEQEFLCSYRWANLMGHGRSLKERSPVAIGDRVRIEQSSPQSGVVTGLCERRNLLARVAPGRDGEEIHVIAANLEKVAIVASVREPDFSTGLVDRYLVAAEAQGISAVICVTKCDLEKPAVLHEGIRLYRELGYAVLEVSARQGLGTEALKSELVGHSVVFCGHSGVGKTSLLTVLTGTRVGKTASISEATGKGKHTTTSSVLLKSPDGNPSTRWIDTPGVREFGLQDIPPERLSWLFPELRQLGCTLQHGCMHRGEAFCEAAGLARYASYRRILDSLLEARLARP